MEGIYKLTSTEHETCYANTSHTATDNVNLIRGESRIYIIPDQTGLDICSTSLRVVGDFVEAGHGN